MEADTTMACCIVGALILSQLLLFWGCLRRWLGLGPAAPVASGAAFWSPGLQPSVHARSPARRLRRGRLALVLGVQLGLAALLGLHWSHLWNEVSLSGANPGQADAPYAAALCSSSTAAFSAAPAVADGRGPGR
jgi:hypothetical protein